MKKNNVMLTEQEKKDEMSLLKESEQCGGMTTDELIQRLSAVSYDDFQNNLKMKIQNYK